MVFAFQKIVLMLILPPAGILIIIAAGWLIIKASRPVGKLLIASGVLLLYLLSTRIGSDALMRPLETSHPPLHDRTAKADAIVVLGGGVAELSWLGLSDEPSAASLERTIAGIRLYKKRRIPMIFMGGSGDPERIKTSDAEAMSRTAAALGVPRKDIIVETRSRNTIEGAGALRQFIKGKRIVLVTSASHMRRAAAMFKSQGYDVAPAPAGYRCEQGGLSFYSFIPRAEKLAISSTAIYEFMSFLWYKSRGRI